ncbi:FAD-binding oxidoreductase [Roseibacterium beibuensis]|uniref:FAD-binding oxidoreductase n=1 Tax=[Roseibacterium] beibuensis TaxID=1193142 RepID=A0ABP9LKI5_9RHOB|nr:FAD-binding oxidoreductase [Roseibacterium beibuensis]MCS6625929.1 FAD-binding oxidoreductase [Roseibacterium beibuensis]
MKTIVIGGGIIGAAIACRLAQAGQEVVVIDAGAGATAQSFGWINASFSLDADHFRLREAGMAAWRRLGDLPGLNWQGSLSWEVQGAALEAMKAELEGFGYPVERVGAKTIRDRVPGLAMVPEAALVCPTEGSVEPGQAAAALMARAVDAGARQVAGARVLEIVERAGRVAGVRTEWGMVPGDAVVVAAGAGAPALVEPLGVALPMLPRPGGLMISRPLPRLLDTILVAPEREIRQDADGRLIVPGSVSHQGDESASLDRPPEALADSARAAVSALFPRVTIDWARIGVAMRPVPGDKRPVIGAAGPEGLYLAVMHSGVTLAAIVAEALADRMAGGEAYADLVAPYDAGRFGAA